MGSSAGSGLYGYSWSSVINSISSLHLGFGTTYVRPCDTNYRAHGHQLRCLSE
ncbi:hypothetical protein [uncultured Rikenella sp.]|uniref:hypothetical protein n=1 Tax=uncultured Rikenella sp. TaxID=368003 RepID=UPI0025D37A67|nr:hypothetical protein [uncultured Rikenella sp.]